MGNRIVRSIYRCFSKAFSWLSDFVQRALDDGESICLRGTFGCCVTLCCFALSNEGLQEERMREIVQIRAARLEDCEELALMFHALWPAGSVEEHGKEVRSLVDGSARLTMPIAVRVAEADGDGVIGFV